MFFCVICSEIYDTLIKVASFGGFLLKENIMTLSFAPRDSHKSQIQFALERGIPAFVAMLGTRRLPFPAYSFDFVHCSRCLIPFTASSELSLCLIQSMKFLGSTFWRSLIFILSNSINGMQMELMSLKSIVCFDQKVILSYLVHLLNGIRWKESGLISKL